MVLRLLYKRLWSARRHLEREDWAVLLIAPLGIPTLALSVAGLTGHGLGRDIWGVGQADLIAFGKYFYVMMLLYVALMFMIKLSLTLFYLTIFPGDGIQHVLWATVAFHVAACLSYVLVLIFQCSPISYEWEKYNFSHVPFADARCINLNVGAWSQAAINVAADIWLLAIPIWQVRKLALSWKKKVGVLLMFMTGAWYVCPPAEAVLTLASPLFRYCVSAQSFGLPKRRIRPGTSGTLCFGQGWRYASGLFVFVCLP